MVLRWSSHRTGSYPSVGPARAPRARRPATGIDYLFESSRRSIHPYSATFWIRTFTLEVVPIWTWTMRPSIPGGSEMICACDAVARRFTHGQKQVAFKEPKTRNGRRQVSLPAWLMVRLKERKDGQCPPCDLIFPDPFAGTVLFGGRKPLARLSHCSSRCHIGSVTRGHRSRWTVTDTSSVRWIPTRRRASTTP